MTFYDEMRAVAAEMLSEFNQAVIKLVVKTAGAGRPFNPGTPTGVETLLKGVATGVPRKYINGTTIVGTELKVTTDVIDGVIPTMSDRISIDGKEHRIITMDHKPSIGTPVVWVFVVER